MVIIRLMGGVGNQMFQYAFGRRLAVETGREVHFDKVNGFARDVFGRKCALEAFNTDLVAAEPGEIPTGMEWGSPWHRLARLGWSVLPVRYSKVVYEGIPFGFDSALVAAASARPTYYFGYWQHEGYFAPIGEEIRRRFELCAPLRPSVLALREEMMRGCSISVHVRNYHDRRADGTVIAKAKEHHGACAWAYYQQAVAAIGDDPKAVCYVFSDDPAWTREHLKLPVPCRYVGDYGVFTDLEEMVLMSSCQHHVIANSSFSWWGAWLGRNPEKIVVAPRIWIRGLQGNAIDICPKNWLRI
jgi:hypothetical protein